MRRQVARAAIPDLRSGNADAVRHIRRASLVNRRSVAVRENDNRIFDGVTDFIIIEAVRILRHLLARPGRVACAGRVVDVAVRRVRPCARDLEPRDIRGHLVELELLCLRGAVLVRRRGERDRDRIACANEPEAPSDVL